MADIKRKAKEVGLKSAKMKKVELIRAIQKKEGNFDCFATANNNSCGQMDCCWRDDCLK